MFFQCSGPHPWWMGLNGYMMVDGSNGYMMVDGTQRIYDVCGMGDDRWDPSGENDNMKTASENKSI
jgi:hypothetical protein